MISSQFPSAVIFLIIVLPVAFAWHVFVGGYFLASLLAAINITALLLGLLLLSGQAGHYPGSILLFAFGVTLLAALAIGLPFLFTRRKGKKREAAS